MAGFHFVLMFILMYAMVDKFTNVIPNLNQVYMAGIMTAPMILLEIWLMGSMYADKDFLNKVFIFSLAIFILFFVGIRRQFAISDKEFLRSMIPHHAAALLMCKNAPIQDPEIKTLCDNILRSQQSEIDFMQTKLIKLNNSN